MTLLAVNQRKERWMGWCYLPRPFINEAFFCGIAARHAPHPHPPNLSLTECAYE